MLHIYRQVTSFRNVRTFVMTKALQNVERFPFSDLEILPRPQMNLFRHGWLKLVERQPPVVYRGEYQMLSSLLERRGADLMHVYFGHTGVHLLPFIECWNKPCVVSFHGADVSMKTDIPDYMTKLRRMFEAVPLVFARSQSLADRLMQLGCPPERVRINRTGVPLSEFPFVARATPTDRGWRFFQASRLIPKKGLATAIRAFAVFHRQYPDAQFVIAGKGPLQPQLEALVAQLGLADNVRFIGFVSQPMLVQLYATADVFLHPSETPPDQNQEGVPNSLLEAMSTGLPVIATNHGGIPEAVIHGKTGLLVGEGDFLALADAMQQLVASSELRFELGKNASASVAANFEQSEQTRQLESYYEEAILARGAPAREEVEVPKPLSAQLTPQVSAE